METVIVNRTLPTKMEEDAARCQIKGFAILRTVRQRRREVETPKRWANAKGLNLEGGGPARRGSGRIRPDFAPPWNPNRSNWNHECAWFGFGKPTLLHCLSQNFDV